MTRFKSITYVEYIAFQETSRFKKSGAEFEVRRRLSRKYATASVLVGIAPVPGGFCGMNDKQAAGKRKLRSVNSGQVIQSGSNRTPVSRACAE
jgi:hypothetical protein